jgi:restriction endonuclease S subunit
MRDGWSETTLDGIAEYINGYPFKPADLGENGVPVIRIKQLLDPNEPVDRTETETPERCLLTNGDIVFSWSGTLAVRIWNRGPAKLNQHLFRVVEKEGVYKGIIPLILDHAIEELEEKSHGTTMKHITKQTLLPHKVLLPPLPEQKRIVDLISSLDSYIEALQQQLETAKRSRNAVLHELMTTGGDDWAEHKLIDMFEIYQPQTIAKSLMSNDGEFIVFGANGPIGRYHKFNHEEPEVVVTCRGATCGTINMTPPKTWITGNAMVVSPKTSGVSKDFLYWALVAGVDIQSVISGSAQPQITREGLAPVKIKIPPLSRQEEIVDLISGFQLTISHLEGSLNKTKTLRSGLLSDLLSGEHEIPASYDKVIGAA